MPAARLARLAQHVLRSTSAQHVVSGARPPPTSSHPVAAAGGSSQWELLLEQREDLSVAAGAPDSVAAALSRGADLRLYMATKDDSADPGGSKGMAKSAAYEETLYFLQTAAPADPESSSGSAPSSAFAGMCPHHTSLVHEGKQPEQPYFSLFRYDTSGTYSQVKWMHGRTIDASQACASFAPGPSEPRQPHTAAHTATHTDRHPDHDAFRRPVHRLQVVCERLLPRRLRARR